MFINKDVIRLDVSVQDHMAVHDVQSSQQLFHHLLDLLKRQWLYLFLVELAESGVAVLKDTMDDLVYVTFIFNHIKDSHKLWILTQTLQ